MRHEGKRGRGLKLGEGRCEVVEGLARSLTRGHDERLIAIFERFAAAHAVIGREGAALGVGSGQTAQG